MNPPKAGLLLAQLGTPDAPTPAALRPYLKEFLEDPRVIEANRIVWWFVLNLFILPFRPARSAALYRRVWTEAGSPLLIHTLAQARGLEQALGGAVPVEPGMRYGNPAAGEALRKLMEKGVDRLLVFPLFPQYCGATTGSVHDAVFDHFKRERVIPAIRFVPPYPTHPAYIGALQTIAGEELARLSWKPDKLLISFHGIPRRYIEAGDVYRTHVEATTAALVKAMDLSAGEYELCFQSRFGKEEWLMPYLDERLGALPSSGVERIAVLCPGFPSDCLETIDEIGHEGAKRFREAGGEELKLIPCLNSHPAWIQAMAAIAREEL
ncbi:MAG TPA: ferrochelatase, partial [Planctomycetota bacterium]|nr:ferrochelatase [Planctomycetota bacterium]